MAQRDATGPSTPSSPYRSLPIGAAVLTRFMNWLEKYLLILVIGGLFAGIGVAHFSQPVVDQVDSVINVFMDLYDLVAPVAIFLILTPSLARLFSTRTMGRFGLYVISWYAVRKVLACLWAIVFILVVFRIPILPQGSLSLGDGITQTVKSLGEMAATSTYFWALYAAVGVPLISTKVPILNSALEKAMDLVETAGSYLMPAMPVFMFGIGAYIYGLPDHVQEQVGIEADARSVLLNLDIWGWTTSPRTPAGMITIYVLGALLTAIACFIWQFAFLFVARSQESRFSILGYFKDYWVKRISSAVGYQLRGFGDPPEPVPDQETRPMGPQRDKALHHRRWKLYEPDISQMESNAFINTPS